MKKAAAILASVLTAALLMLFCAFFCPRFSVTYADWDGEIISEQRLAYGRDAEVPEAPERRGYSFAGWDTDALRVTEDVTVTALYERVYYDNAVTASRGGEISVSEQKPYAGQTVRVSAVPDTGYELLEVRVDGPSGQADVYAAGSGWEFVQPAERVEITARFAHVVYTVTFLNSDGTLLSTGRYFYGDEIDVPEAPQKPSDGSYAYSFAGWYPDLTDAVCASGGVYTATYEAKRITCGYCGSAEHTESRCALKSVANGAEGRLIIPDVGVNVAYYNSWAQSVCDAWDSAAKNRWGSQTVIGDHRNQGFEAIKSCTEGTLAYLDTGTESTEYTCTGLITGHNTGLILTDDDYNSIADSNPGGLTLYTCNDCWQNITIVFFQPTS